MNDLNKLISWLIAILFIGFLVWVILNPQISPRCGTDQFGEPLCPPGKDQ